jgi:transcriptional regulator
MATVIVRTEAGLEINPVPLLLDLTRGPHGTLIGHVARRNPLAQCDGKVGTAIFHGPNAYVSPNWYPGKPLHGKVVPTWNYAMIEARGTLRGIEEPNRLLDIVRTLTNHFEADQPHPWTVEDAPADYIDDLLGAITGIELQIDSLLGKFKLSQNRPASDQIGIAAGLAHTGDANAVAVAGLMHR